MSADCCSCCAPTPATDPRFRRVLWVALVLNAVMFGVEFAGGLAARSVSLTADSLDFLADAANYAVSLAVLGMSLRARARATLAKGLSLGAVGVWVSATLVWNLFHGTVPRAELMGAVGLLALAVNAGVAMALYRWRDGDANVRSVWLCSRNDAIGNLVVLVAALGVWGSASGWPDLAVAAILAWLPLSAAVKIVRQSLGELRTA
ncbi:MAG: cation transporter [Magnetospirillum sp.]|nr:cation transporter [Magnetospirillum sp.]